MNQDILSDERIEELAATTRNPNRRQVIGVLKRALAEQAESARSAIVPNADALDAVRYRWLRSEVAATDPRYYAFWNEFNAKLCREEKMDKAIDAAMLVLPTCPKCGAEDSMEHRQHRFSTEGGPNLPDCDWDECVVCGHRTDPE